MAETWVINEIPGIGPRTQITTNVPFNSYNNNYNTFIVRSGPTLSRQIRYDSMQVYSDDPGILWLDQNYRTVTFDTAPTGDLLTWLQANAVKQEPEPTETTNIKIGTATLQDIYIGDSKIAKVYVGSTVVWEKGESGGYDFANDSWATIASQIKAGTDHYNLGDTKTDSIIISGTQYAGTYNVTFKIVDNTVGRYVTQSGQSHKVIEIQEVFGNTVDGGVVWNNSVLVTSFNASDIKNTLNNTIVNFLPSELRAVLETTTVYSGDGTQTASSSTNVGATCKLFVASYNEYYGADSSFGWANNSETNGKGQFTWYQQAGVTTSNFGALIKYKIENTSNAYQYWTRSPYLYDGDDYYNPVEVDSYGRRNDTMVYSGFTRVAPCFAW